MLERSFLDGGTQNDSSGKRSSVKRAGAMRARGDVLGYGLGAC